MTEASKQLLSKRDAANRAATRLYVLATILFALFAFVALVNYPNLPPQLSLLVAGVLAFYGRLARQALPHYDRAIRAAATTSAISARGLKEKLEYTQPSGILVSGQNELVDLERAEAAKAVDRLAALQPDALIWFDQDTGFPLAIQQGATVRLYELDETPSTKFRMGSEVYLFPSWCFVVYWLLPQGYACLRTGSLLPLLPTSIYASLAIIAGTLPFLIYRQRRKAEERRRPRVLGCGDDHYTKQD